MFVVPNDADDDSIVREAAEARVARSLSRRKRAERTNSKARLLMAVR
jgi:hypothetical protein